MDPPAPPRLSTMIGLAQLLGKRILQYACDYVGAASRRIRHYEGDRLSRPLREACEVTTKAQGRSRMREASCVCPCIVIGATRILRD